jgi:hypothetical protein
MISHKHRAIFVHIQKTGGNSVSAALGEHDSPPEKHRTALELQAFYGENTWRDYYKFSFVRDPWDRMVSWWSMIDGARPAFEAGKTFNRFQTFILMNARTFDEFLIRCDEEVDDFDGRKWIYRNQVDYLIDGDGKVMVDFVGRFETIKDDFSVVARKLGMSIDLPHVNRSGHRHYTDYYTPSLADIVRKRFARDIKAFGYAFG